MSTTMSDGNIIFGDGTSQTTAWTGTALWTTSVGPGDDSTQIASTSFVKNTNIATLNNGQFWHDVTSSRAADGTYYYNYGYAPQMISVVVICTGAINTGNITAGDVYIVRQITGTNQTKHQYTFLVPPYWQVPGYDVSKSRYQVTLTSGSIHKWLELR